MATINDLYLKYTNKVGRTLESDRYFQYLFEMIQAGDNELIQNYQVMHKVVDERWLGVIEDSLDAINTIIEKPRRFIATKEEVVPVALARKITAESVRHLSQHTQFIASSENGDIQPTRVLNVSTEESYNLYENRFIYHLIQRLVTFIDKRTDVIFWVTGDETQNVLSYQSKIDDAYEEIEYKIEMKVKNRQSLAENDSDNMQIFMRIDRVRRMVLTLKNSAFCSIMAGCSKVRSPIQRTNLIMKDPDYRKCYQLWQFLENYDEVGYSIEVQNTALEFDEEYLIQMYTNLITNYTVFKSLIESDSRNLHEAELASKKKVIKPRFLKKIKEEFVDDPNIEDVEIRKVFVQEVTQAQLDAEAALEREIEARKQAEQNLEDMDAQMISLQQQVSNLMMMNQEAEVRAAEEREAKEAALAEVETARQAQTAAEENAEAVRKQADEEIRATKENAANEIQATKESAANEIAVTKENAAKEIRITKETTANEIAVTKQQAEENMAATRQVADEQIAAMRKQADEEIAVAKETAEKEIALTKEAADNEIQTAALRVRETRKQAEEQIAAAKQQAAAEVAAAKQQAAAEIAAAKQQAAAEIAAMKQQADEQIATVKQQAVEQIATAKLQAANESAAAKQQTEEQLAFMRQQADTEISAAKKQLQETQVDAQNRIAVSEQQAAEAKAEAERQIAQVTQEIETVRKQTREIVDGMQKQAEAEITSIKQEKEQADIEATRIRAELEAQLKAKQDELAHCKAQAEQDMQKAVAQQKQAEELQRKAQERIAVLERKEESLSNRLEEVNRSWENLELRLQDTEKQVEDARQKVLAAEERAKANTLSHYIISALNGRKRRNGNDEDKD